LIFLDRENLIVTDFERVVLSSVAAKALSCKSGTLLRLNSRGQTREHICARMWQVSIYPIIH
jgi:hypothetical protein